MAITRYYAGDILYAVMQRSGANQAVNDITTTTLTFNSKDDPYNMATTGTGAFLIPRAGNWMFDCMLSWTADFAAFIDFYVHNSTAGIYATQLRAGSDMRQGIHITGMLRCNFGDLIYAKVYQDSVGTQNISYARFQAQWMSP